LSALLFSLKGFRNKILNWSCLRISEAILGLTNGQQEKVNIVDLLNIHGIGGLMRAYKGLVLFRKLHAYVDLLVDVHGHQIFVDGIFNGDPHPGNIMELEDGKLGLIDFGQTMHLTDKERFDYARVIAAVGSRAPVDEIAGAMRQVGFRSRTDNSENLAAYASLFFDSDHISKEKGFATPQHYFESIMSYDPLVVIPESAIMIARASLLFRGAGSALQYPVKTSDNWRKHAMEALANAE